MFRLNLFSYFGLFGNTVLNSVIHNFSFLGNPVEIYGILLLWIFGRAWLIAAVLKTVGCKSSGGSNPSKSSIKKIKILKIK